MGKDNTEIVPGRGTAAGGAASAVACARPGDDERAPRCLVVMYHYVHDAEPLRREGIAGMTSREFRAQLDRLASSMEPIDWPTLYSWMSGRQDIPRRCFALTFDDGLADHARVVAPILDELGLRGTFFVPGAVLVTHELRFAHAVHLLVSTLGQSGFQKALYAYLSAHSARDWQQAVDADAAQAMYHYEPRGQACLKYLLTMVLPLELRTAAVSTLFEQHVGSLARWARAWYMNWDEVRGLEDRGHTVGGHGFSHEPLDRLSDGAVRQDVLQVASVLREGLGPDLRPFSYPYGRVTDAAQEACARAGFVQSMTTVADWAKAGMDAHLVPRVDTIHVESFLSMDTSCQVQP